MPVEITFTTTLQNCTQSERDSLLADTDALHDTMSDTGGTYQAERCAYQPDDTGWEVHIGISLTDADDSQYPDCKDDLAQALAAFGYDLGTATEIKADLQGKIT